MRRSSLSCVIALSLLVQLLVIGSASAATVEAEMRGIRFVPTEIAIDPGDTVTWTNNDSTTHTVTRVDDDTELGRARGGETVSATFDEGVHELLCSIHPSMRVTVTAGGDTDPAPAEPQPGQPGPDDGTVRLAGEDTVATAIAWSTRRYADGGAQAALLGRDDLFADSLSSGGAQAALDAPLLLTPRTQLDPRTRGELSRLDVDTVFVLGGDAAIADTVLETLRSDGYAVERVSAADRVGTAVAVAERFYPEARRAVIARAFGGTEPTQAFADSLAAGAHAARVGIPVLLSTTHRLSPGTEAYLREQGITDVLIAGGEAALGAEVAAAIRALDITVDRAAGATRVETAAAIASRSDDSDAVTYVDGTQATAWADGFGAAGDRAPVLLTSGAFVQAPTLARQLVVSPRDRVCGTSVDASACDEIAIAGSADLAEADGVTTELDGASEAPEMGDPDASGRAVVVPTSSPTAVCFSWSTENLDPPASAAHIHRGAPGVAGPIVIDLSDAGTVGDPEVRFGCAFELPAQVVTDVFATPDGFYVNVHNEAFPMGAIRGQLR